MRMTHSSYWWDTRTGVCMPNPHSPPSTSATGWPDLETFQRECMRATNQVDGREYAFATPTGVMFVQSDGFDGLRSVQHVEVTP